MAILLACTMAAAGCSSRESGVQEISEQINDVQDSKLTIGDTEVPFDDEDTYRPWEEDEAVKISLADGGITIDGEGASAEGNTVTIESGGTYVLEGSLSDGTVRVETEDEETVRLVLNGVKIHSETSAAIDIADAKKAVISLEEGTVNTLSDSSGFTYRDEDKEEPNAVLFCKNDLTINGDGKLAVESVFNNAVQSKDVLKIMGGSYEISSANHGIKGNDALVVNGGEIRISSVGDGLKSDTALAVLDGDVVISQCEEGLEAETIVIGGGTIDVTASDDGINASTDGTAVPAIYIGGGVMTVRAEGDGIDSNGSVYMSGGEVTVYGPKRNGNGALDYDRDFQITGGVLAAFGPGGMDSHVGESSSQAAFLMTYEESQPAGTVTVLKDEEGNELYRWSGEKAYRTVVISVPELKKGNTYQLETGEGADAVLVEFNQEETVLWLDKDGVTDGAAMTFGGRGGGPGGKGGAGGREGGPDGGKRPGRENAPGGEGRPEGENAPGGEGRPEGESAPGGEGRPDKGGRTESGELPKGENVSDSGN